MNKGENRSVSEHRLNKIQHQDNIQRKNKSYRKRTEANRPSLDRKSMKTKSNGQLKVNNNEERIDSKKINSFLRSKAFSVNLMKPSEQGIKLNNPYENIAKQLNIKLPTPKQKFLQFLEIPPFNRLSNHVDFIGHILQKKVQFFRKHPPSLVDNIAQKIVRLDPNDIPSNNVVILDEGICYYDYLNADTGKYEAKLVKKGSLIVRSNFDVNKFSYDQNSNMILIGLHHHDYSSFISQYLNENFQHFKSFLTTIQIFKIFSEEAIQKILSSLTLSYYVQGQALFHPGDQAKYLYVIFSGRISRKIIVQLDKTNKIPLQGVSKLVKVLSRSYEHRIEFQKEDLVGVTEIVDKLPTRSETITVSQDSTILAIDRNCIEENIDEYIEDRLKKYNMRKYPRNYDQLCDNYLKQKMENRRMEERKIAALKNQHNRNNNEKKTQKIDSIIKIYQNRIRKQENQHLIEHRKIQRIMQSDN